MVEESYETAERQRRQNHVGELGYSKEEPQTMTAFKNALMEPERPQSVNSEEDNFYKMLTKDLGISKLSIQEVEQARMYAMAHSICRLMGLHKAAAFLSSEVSYNLNLHKSVDGWQQEKFNELRSSYKVETTTQDKIKDAAGVQR